MCESKAFLRRKGSLIDEPYLYDVARLEPRGDDVYLRNVLGEERTLRARIREISFMDHRIVLEET